MYVVASVVYVTSPARGLEYANGRGHEFGIGFRMDQKNASAFVAGVVD